jgi:probable rRNA maturation factor
MRTRSARSRNNLVVQLAVAPRGVPPVAAFRRWAAGAGARGAITLRVVGEAEARTLNRTYRAIDHATNVLSFPYARGTGDIVLCHAVIAREARAQHKPVAAHYAHMIVHGVLHLRGYDHGRAREAARMEKAEARILRRLGFANPYAVK